MMSFANDDDMVAEKLTPTDFGQTCSNPGKIVRENKVRRSIEVVATLLIDLRT
jgi:hypothetical protein